MISFPVTANHSGNAWRNTKYLRTCARKNRLGMFSTKGSHYWTCILMLLFCFCFFPKYRKLYIHFYFQILKHTGDNSSLRILHRSLHYYSVLFIRGTSWSKSYFSSAIGHRIQVTDLKDSMFPLVPFPERVLVRLSFRTAFMVHREDCFG